MKVDRRDFCLGLGSAACLSACKGVPKSVPIPDADPPSSLALSVHGSGSARVVEARWARAVDAAGRVDAAAVRTMLDAALAALEGEKPYARLLGGSSQRVSIKVNSIKSHAYTHPELAAALAAGLASAGVAASRISVWDKDSAGLTARGYRLDPSGAELGYRCLGTDAADPSPKKLIIDGKSVHLSPLLSEADLLVNVAALKDHSMAGVTLSLKNNFGLISGAELLHGNIKQGSGCEPGISELAARPEIRDKLRIAAIDALVGVCQGGPGPTEARYAFRYGGLLLSRDPVALDRRGLQIIEARRKALGLCPLGQRTSPNPSPPIHIDAAAARGVSPG